MVEDREFIDAAAKGLSIEAEPFRPLAERLGLTVEETLMRLRRLVAEGKVRRFAASVRHQPLGFTENAMLIARVEEETVDAVGQAASALPEVSHCYLRDHPDGDPWCIYIMAHARDEEALARVVEAVRSLPGVRKLEVGRSRGELKKTSLSAIRSQMEEEDGDQV
jgi:DNA-binding Lrp family transcriptional regulator